MQAEDICFLTYPSTVPLGCVGLCRRIWGRGLILAEIRKWATLWVWWEPPHCSSLWERSTQYRLLLTHSGGLPVLQPVSSDFHDHVGTCFCLLDEGSANLFCNRLKGGCFILCRLRGLYHCCSKTNATIDRREVSEHSWILVEFYWREQSRKLSNHVPIPVHQLPGAREDFSLVLPTTPVCPSQHGSWKC